MKRVAIVGAGLSGLVAAWELTRGSGGAVAVTLLEATERCGGIVETVRVPAERGGGEFVLELGPDGWLTEKTAARELVRELGLEGQCVGSNDLTRKTYLAMDGGAGPRLEAMPDNLRMMVPVGRAGLLSVEGSPLFSAEARAQMRAEVSRAEELRREAPRDDESIASFTERHFGREVLETLAAPLLSGVFGGDVHALSVRAVMAPFVAMERQQGSLILALEEREAERRAIEQTGGQRASGAGPGSLFTSLRGGMGVLTEALEAGLPAGVLETGRAVEGLERGDGTAWRLRVRAGTGEVVDEAFDEVVLATPAHRSAELLRGVDGRAAELLPADASSAVLVVFAWEAVAEGAEPIRLPPGFGFLVPPPRPGRPAVSPLLACTFADQKFVGRAPAGGRVLRAFFGGEAARTLLARGADDAAMELMAFRELERLLGPLPEPQVRRVRRWPRSLPLYAVGHLERVAEMEQRMLALPGLHVLGNGLHGVGLPDLIRQARTRARAIAGGAARSA